MRFSTWPVLIALILIPIFHRWWKKRNQPARVTYSIPIPVAASGRNPQRWLLLLKYAGLALTLIALARPQSSFKQTERQVSGIDIMMVLDVSASMDIEDLGERSRLDIAKEVMENFIKGRSNDRIGFLVFSGEPLTMAPPTLDYALVLKSLHEARTNYLKDGTAIGDALAVAVNRLRNSTAKSRVIILLTDGDNNLGKIDPATAGELAAGYGIRAYTIAIGKEGRVRVPIKRQGIFGNTITSYQYFDNALNPELLKNIAQTTDGKFYRVTDENTLDSVFHEIDKLEKSGIQTHEKVRYEEAYEKPLKWGMIALIAERIFAQGWWRVLP